MNICAIATDHLRSLYFAAGLQRTAIGARTTQQAHLSRSTATSTHTEVIDGVSVDTLGSGGAQLTGPDAATSSLPAAQGALYSSVRPDGAAACELAERVEALPANMPGANQARGVVRLLEQGHFKGVADVRLRLNFFDRLDHEALPELRPPNGNGRAYDKFVQMYVEWQGGQGGGDAVDEIA